MSSNDWRRYKLKDLCLKIGSGATPRGGKEAYLEDGPYSLIRSQNVLDFYFSYDGLAYINGEQALQLNNVELQENDVLLNITGDSVARVCQVPKDLLPARVNQHVSIIRPDSSKLNPVYLKYFLLNPKFKDFMLGLASVGGTRNALTKGMIEDFEIDIPPLITQCRIAYILSALDEKIELNRQTNATLEAIAQAIFKEWFVDFRFPGATGEMVDVGATGRSPLPARIPRGWRVGRLGDICEFAYGKGLKSENRAEGNYPVIGSNGIVGTHNEYLVEGPGIVIGRKGTIGEVTWIHDHFFPIDTTFYIRDLLGVRDLYFHYFLLKIQDFKQISSDSAVPGLNRNQAYDNKVVIPPSDVITQFNEFVFANFESILSNEQQSATLASIRDALLPKLMTGEIEV